MTTATADPNAAAAGTGTAESGTPPPAPPTPPTPPPTALKGDEPRAIPPRTLDSPEGASQSEHDDFIATSTSDSAEDVAAALGLTQAPTEEGKAATGTPPPDPNAAPPTPGEKTAEETASEAGRALNDQKRSLQSRLAAATYEREQSELRLRATVEENARLARELEEARRDPAKAPQPVKLPDEPKFEDFQDEANPYAAYSAAAAKWAVEVARLNAEQARKAETDASTASAREQAQRDAFNARIASQQNLYAARKDAYWEEHPQAKTDIEAFAEAQKALKPEEMIRIPNVMEDLILESELGPQMMHHLATKPDEFRRIATLPTVAAIVLAIGELQAEVRSALRLRAKTPTPPPNPAAILARTARAPSGSPAATSSPTLTPPPLTPPAGASAASGSETDLEKMSQEEYNRYMNDRQKRRLGR